MPLREPDVLGADASLFQSVVKGACDVIPCDDLKRDEEVPRFGGDLCIVRDHLDAADAHPIAALDAKEVRLQPHSLEHAEPVRARPAQRLALVGHQARDHLVEHADLVREPELKLGRRDLVDFLDLAFPEELHGRENVGALLGLAPRPLYFPSGSG